MIDTLKVIKALKIGKIDYIIINGDTDDGLIYESILEPPDGDKVFGVFGAKCTTYFYPSQSIQTETLNDREVVSVVRKAIIICNNTFDDDIKNILIAYRDGSYDIAR